MEPAENKPPILRFDRVNVSFEGVEALRDMTFEAREGESRVILGAAGSGKTVLLKTALGLVRPDSGSVYVFGRDISRLEEHELFEIRSRIGMLFQESALFDSMSIEDNVAYPLLNQKSIQCPADEVHSRVSQALEFVELGRTLAKFPSELSGGMRRRAAIARAVVTEPPLVLYDSPTAGLDPITAQTIITLILRLRDVYGVTALMATHRLQDGFALANFHFDPKTRTVHRGASSNQDKQPITRFLVLRDGGIYFEGSPDELLKSKDSYLQRFLI